MYPMLHFRLFPAFPVEQRVFVIMDFSKRFDSRYELIKKGIESVKVDGTSLSAYRADTSVISAPVLSDILIAISRSALVLTDITTLRIDPDDGRPLRNGNVMYELGIAHSERLPEENLIYRSDHDSLPFDVANIRVNQFDPEGDPGSTVSAIANAVVTSLRGLDGLRLLSVRRAVASLDSGTAAVLLEASTSKQPLKPMAVRTQEDAMAFYMRTRPFEKLLELGAIEAKWPILGPEARKQPADFKAIAGSVEYQVTNFGRTVAAAIVSNILERPPGL
jgi:hypothetical protein